MSYSKLCWSSIFNKYIIHIWLLSGPEHKISWDSFVFQKYFIMGFGLGLGFGFLFAGFLSLGFFWLGVERTKPNQNKIKFSLISHWHFQLSVIFLTQEKLWPIWHFFNLNRTGKIFPSSSTGCSFQVLLTSGRSNNQNPTLFSDYFWNLCMYAINLHFQKDLILSEIFVRNIL